MLRVNGRIRWLLRRRFKRMRNGVRLMMFLSPKEEHYERCEAVARFVEAIVEESCELIEVETYWEDEDREVFERYSIRTVPTIALLNGHIRYSGVPAGTETISLVETIVGVSRRESGLSSHVVRRLREELEEPVYVEVLVSPECPLCPQASLLTNMFAMESYGKVASDIVEVYENPEVMERYGVTKVPAIAVNDRVEIIGAPSAEELLEAILRGRWARAHQY